MQRIQCDITNELEALIRAQHVLLVNQPIAEIFAVYIDGKRSDAPVYSYATWLSLNAQVPSSVRGAQVESTEVLANTSPVFGAIWRLINALGRF